MKCSFSENQKKYGKLEKKNIKLIAQAYRIRIVKDKQQIYQNIQDNFTEFYINTNYLDSFVTQQILAISYT